MSGKKSKQQGSSFEYRIRDWFRNREGWFAERNPLSGASEQISESVGKHDVRAWNNKSIFLQVEAKKRTRVKDPKKRRQIEVMKEWIDKIDFNNDEILVIGFDRTEPYVLITTDRFFKILGRSYSIEYNKDNSYGGSTQFVLKQSNLEDEYYHLWWKAFDEHYTMLTLEKFITLRETIRLDEEKELSIEELIKRCTDIEKLKEIENERLEELSYTQKRLLYQKFEQLESDSFINPLAHAQSQFWLDDAFICTCPHCSEKITTKDLRNSNQE